MLTSHVHCLQFMNQAGCWRLIALSCSIADVVSGVQGSLQSLLHMTTFAAALLCSRFRAFPWLMATSCAAALAGLLSAATLSTITLLASALAVASHVVPVLMQEISEAGHGVVQRQ